MEPSPDLDTRTVDDLIDLAESIPDSMGLSDGLAAIRGTASGTGISLAVDLHGLLVELDLDDRALKLGPDPLAAEISALVGKATTHALQQGMRAITAGCVPGVAKAIADQLGIDGEPEPPSAEPAPSAQAEPAPQPRSARPAPSASEEDESDGGFAMKDAWTT